MIVVVYVNPDDKMSVHGPYADASEASTDGAALVEVDEFEFPRSHGFRSGRYRILDVTPPA
jgi:hypothetical protein